MRRALVLAALVAVPALARVPWDPLPPGAYELRRRHPAVQSALFAFDYGHALIYDKLLKLKLDGDKYDPDEIEEKLQTEILDILDKETLVKVDEDDIAPDYARKFSLTLSLFDWSHYLHQFTYDMLVLPGTDEQAAGRIRSIYRGYLGDPGLVISDKCLSMAFMNQRLADGQDISKSFMKEFPALNDLIWLYHYLQIALYDALQMPAGASRNAAVADLMDEFRGRLKKIPGNFVHMPLMDTVVPRFAEKFPEERKHLFAKRFPRIANVFDNLHSLHDILSDLLVSPKAKASVLSKEGRRFARMAMDPPAEYLSSRCLSEKERSR